MLVMFEVAAQEALKSIKEALGFEDGRQNGHGNLVAVAETVRRPRPCPAENQGGRGMDMERLEDLELSLSFFTVMAVVFAISLVLLLLDGRAMWAAVSAAAAAAFALLAVRQRHRIDKLKGVESYAAA